MHVIVGIDPGTTAGIAVLDFNGELVDLFSSKDMGIDEVLRHITKFGVAAVIASDVNPAPQFASRLSAKTGAVVFNPYISLSVKEKTELTKDYPFRDPHQRDALAAALNAFNKFKNKFAKIDSMDFGEICLSDDKKDYIKSSVLRGHSIDSAIKDLLEGIKKPDAEKKADEEYKNEPEPEPSAEARKIKDLENQNRTLREEIVGKEREIEELNNSILEAKRKYSLELHRDSKIEESDQIIQSFEYGMKDLQARLNEKINQIEKLVELWGMASKGEILPVGVFPERFSGMSWMRRNLKKKDYMDLQKIKILFLSNIEEHKELFEHRILLCDEKYLKEFSGCAYITSGDLEAAKKESEETKHKLMKVDERKLVDIISSYRSDRK